MQAIKPTAGAPLPRIWRDGPGSCTNSSTVSGSSGAPGLVTIITGSRGIGKTVMLSAAESITRQHRRAAISRTDNSGFLAKVGDDMFRLLDELGDGSPARKITASSAAD
ncbi:MULTISPECIES: hypothetical protein [Arthrobacter]|uniref:Orc1-like AAA ATPase domain-containing protein n=1 Tax=Arthrobacter terricola TaxID=2547396 RepID=A0A4R5K7E1_9MICC|nr:MULTISPECIES: hypothetical protein [Arthrobacter]MBT8163323.1 ATP-binding protein [Arthrobacter sp. GN70]TDF91011.1 hypothetical protein E1809_22005 [Arthrobacter terricola]